MVKHLISINEITKNRIDRIINITKEILKWEEWQPDLEDIIVGNLFLEPSTRTRVSFEAAVKRLGGHTINLIGEGTTSIKKGEDMKDTIAMLSQYCDVIVTRTKERLTSYDLEDSAVPVINGGDGSEEHPTQAISDLFTIQEHFPKLARLNVLVMGDCKNSRAVHSFVLTALKYEMNVCCFSPKDIELSTLYHTAKEQGESLGNTVEMISEEKELNEALELADIVYCVRFQEERHTSYGGTTYGVGGKHIEKITTYNYVQKCGFKEEMLERLQRTAMIMHPLPRGGEMPKKIDKDRRCAYFEQAQNALYVRMAILKEILE